MSVVQVARAEPESSGCGMRERDAGCGMRDACGMQVENK